MPWSSGPPARLRPPARHPPARRPAGAAGGARRRRGAAGAARGLGRDAAPQPDRDRDARGQRAALRGAGRVLPARARPAPQVHLRAAGRRGPRPSTRRRRRCSRLTCERAGLADGQRVLDLGCGWGSLTLWMAERYPREPDHRGLELGEPAGVHPGRGGRARGLGNVEVVTADMNAFEPRRALRPRGLRRDVRAHAELRGPARADRPLARAGRPALRPRLRPPRRRLPLRGPGARRLDGPPLLHRRADAVRRPAAPLPARPARGRATGR